MLETIYFRNAHVLNNLQKCLKTDVFTARNPFIDSDGLLAKRFVKEYLDIGFAYANAFNKSTMLFASTSLIA